VVKAWQNDQVPLQEYKVGSTGPAGWSLPQRRSPRGEDELHA
jgi:hypothetical protein